MWVRRVQEQMRILHSKKFPSDVSLTSNSSSWSGMSAHSSGNRTLQQSNIPPAGHAQYTALSGMGGGAFQYMDPT